MTNPQIESAMAQAAVEAALAKDREAALRDAFAGGVLSAIIAHYGVAQGYVSRRDQVVDAYDYADQMMRYRKQST